LLTEPRRIACIHLNQIGDLLFSLPALYNLRVRFPEARITSIVRPQCKELLSLSGLVDEIIERPRGADLRLAMRLRQSRFDLLLLFSTSVTSWLIAQLSDTRVVGFTHSLGGFRFAQRVPWMPPPSTQNNLRLVEAIGCPAAKTEYTGLIRPGCREQDEAERILCSAGIMAGDRFVALCPGASTGREVKCWTDEGFAQLADKLGNELSIKSVVIGVDGGERVCRRSNYAADLTGKTSLPALSCVLGRAEAFVGMDSGIMHLAAAMETPVIALFGPTDPSVTGPQGMGHRIVGVDLPCRPCLKSKCPIDRRCMMGITPEAVIAEVKKVLCGI
jgi:heptosyltransferase I